MFCQTCGKEIPEDVRFCSECGAPCPEPPVPTGKKTRSRDIYVMLAFFFTLLGIHNFYARRYWIGFAQLIVSPITIFIIPEPYDSLLIAWVVIEMLVVQKDGAGIPMKCSRGTKALAPVFAILLVVIVIMSANIL